MAPVFLFSVPRACAKYVRAARQLRTDLRCVRAAALESRRSFPYNKKEARTRIGFARQTRRKAVWLRRFSTIEKRAALFGYKAARNGGTCSMNLLVIDEQGGGIGKQLISAVKSADPEIRITAVGTNAAAASAMLKAGADEAAAGENAVVVCSRNADVIAGPIGIVIADALLGEITPRMAQAVGQSAARRILIPINHCGNIVAGVDDGNIGRLIRCAIAEIEKLRAPSV